MHRIRGTRNGDVSEPATVTPIKMMTRRGDEVEPQVTSSQDFEKTKTQKRRKKKKKRAKKYEESDDGRHTPVHDHTRDSFEKSTSKLANYQDTSEDDEKKKAAAHGNEIKN